MFSLLKHRHFKGQQPFVREGEDPLSTSDGESVLSSSDCDSESVRYCPCCSLDLIGDFSADFGDDFSFIFLSGAACALAGLRSTFQTDFGLILPKIPLAFENFVCGLESILSGSFWYPEDISFDLFLSRDVISSLASFLACLLRLVLCSCIFLISGWLLFSNDP